MNEKQTHNKRESGQSMVEMALMSTVLILLLAGVLDFGRMYFTYLALQNAAGEGATYGSIFPYNQYPPGHPDCPDTSVCSASAIDPDNIIYRVQHESPNSGLIDWSGTDVTVIPELDPPLAGTLITVTVAFDYDVVTPVIEAITGDTLTLRATAVNTIVGK